MGINSRRQKTSDLVKLLEKERVARLAMKEREALEDIERAQAGDEGEVG